MVLFWESSQSLTLEPLEIRATPFIFAFVPTVSSFGIQVPLTTNGKHRLITPDDEENTSLEDEAMVVLVLDRFCFQ